MMLAYHLSWGMLDASNVSEICPFHSLNVVYWSSVCQSNLGGWNMSKLAAIVLEIDEM